MLSCTACSHSISSYAVTFRFPPDQRYPSLYSGDYGLTAEVSQLAEFPLDLFLFFMPKKFWRQVAKESNRYFLHNLTACVDRMYEKQRIPGKKSREEFIVREAKKDEIEPHKIMHVLGLLMARMLNPQCRRFRDHWTSVRVGVVPRGTSNAYMPRHRFEHIMANLHFTNSADVRAASDRAWKVRSVIDTLQERFLRGYITPPFISFDEGIIPSRNRQNPTWHTSM
ncbi:unnamed protein product [Phytophthora fragariaefolia]|uniref:Unnamed protein product n=1 Tax=Phytophthora fragariaefolia TaxID=1490495 RepID=A0A9W6Y9U4_9STRA|nr:unnamed protein product [Phytophthora fragariaefolia]